MKLFKKRASQGSRRSSRLGKLRLMRNALAGSLVAGVVGLAIYGWTQGVPERAAAAFHDTSMRGSAALGFKVNEILVTGRNSIPQDELLTHLGLAEGTPIFAVDIAASQELLKNISWVKTVRVSRRLPDKIVVSIEEREPLALWQYKKKIAAIDAEGVSLTSNGLEKYSDLPLIVGEDAPRHVMELVGLMQAEPEIARQLESAVRVGSRRWDLRLKSGIDIRLPENNVELALSRLVSAAQDDGILSKNLTVIDLRIPEKLIVTPVAQKEEAGKKADKKTNI